MSDFGTPAGDQHMGCKYLTCPSRTIRACPYRGVRRQAGVKSAGAGGCRWMSVLHFAVDRELLTASPATATATARNLPQLLLGLEPARPGLARHGQAKQTSWTPHPPPRRTAAPHSFHISHGQGAAGSTRTRGARGRGSGISAQLERGQSRAGQGRAGQGRAQQSRAGQGRAWLGRAGQGRAGKARAGQGRPGQGRPGQYYPLQCLQRLQLAAAAPRYVTARQEVCSKSITADTQGRERRGQLTGHTIETD